MREKQAVTRRDSTTRDNRDAIRRAQREADEAEQEVGRLERRIVELTTTLADPALYTQSDGVETAGRLGTELDETRSALERAIDRWTNATERAESLSPGSDPAGKVRR
jgi:hypothetical protein